MSNKSYIDQFNQLKAKKEELETKLKNGEITGKDADKKIQNLNFELQLLEQSVQIHQLSKNLAEDTPGKKLHEDLTKSQALSEKIHKQFSELSKLESKVKLDKEKFNFHKIFVQKSLEIACQEVYRDTIDIIKKKDIERLILTNQLLHNFYDTKYETIHHQILLFQKNISRLNIHFQSDFKANLSETASNRELEGEDFMEIFGAGMALKSVSHLTNFATQQIGNVVTIMNWLRNSHDIFSKEVDISAFRSKTMVARNFLSNADIKIYFDDLITHLSIEDDELFIDSQLASKSLNQLQSDIEFELMKRKSSDAEDKEYVIKATELLTSVTELKTKFDGLISELHTKKDNELFSPIEQLIRKEYVRKSFTHKNTLVLYIGKPDTSSLIDVESGNIKDKIDFNGGCSLEYVLYKANGEIVFSNTNTTVFSSNYDLKSNKFSQISNAL